ncbi:phosphate transporter subunit; membrane component of ABC superfamily [Candidatus Sulfopaludibacter sp. SbA3]|nr:phosphate transporter subunit; membrane component of ABC superfamily [Candidatus Sulfopaludibacter sp. SbA3]
MSAPAIVANKSGRARRVWYGLRGGDEVAHFVTFLFAASVLLMTAFLVYELWVQSAESRTKFGFHFLATSNWDPVAGDFGALPFIYGTVLTSILALVISIPLAVGAAIFLSELAPPAVSSTCTFLVELLAAIPSVIYGLLALFTIVPLMRTYGEPFLKSTLGFLPFFQGPAIGVGYLSAGVVLAVMTFPFIIAISRESLMEVPRDQREAALALGATRWESTFQVVVPYARLGILGSIFLGLARALGETMAVTMVIGNDPSIHASLFAPGYTIAAVIANEFAEAGTSLHTSALIEMGLVLFLVTIIVNALARLLVIATSRKGTAQSA